MIGAAIAAVRRLAGPLLVVGLTGLIWVGYDRLGLLRRTPLWEVRYLVLGAAVVALLGAAHWAWERLRR